MADEKVDQDKLAEEWLSQMESGGPAPAADPKPAAQKPQFQEIRDERRGGPAKDIDFLLDIPLVVTVELGRTKMIINDLLQLGQGSVVELDKLAGEPMEILINQKLVARGEVVVVNEKFGIRLTDIISPTERLKQLR
jgi:flagellar motor switch protein FliN